MQISFGYTADDNTNYYFSASNETTLTCDKYFELCKRFAVIIGYIDEAIEEVFNA